MAQAPRGGVWVVGTMSDGEDICGYSQSTLDDTCVYSLMFEIYWMVRAVNSGDDIPGVILFSRIV